MKTTLTTLLAFLLIQFASFSQEKTETSISDISFYEGPSVYPNPASNHLTLQYGYHDELGTTAYVQFETRGLVDLFSINGQSTMETITLSDQVISQEIPVSELRSGVYFLVLQFDEEEPIVKKVIVL